MLTIARVERHPKTTLLSGSAWEVKGFLGDDWLVRDVHKPTTRDRHGWMPADVPGSVQSDLVRAGVLADPYHGMNSLAAEWVPQRTWVYRTRFRAGSDRLPRSTLRFEGIDYDARVFLDGDELGHSRGMYRPFEVDISERLRDGAEHYLAVVIAPAPPCVPQVGRTEDVRIHKSRMGYGWDFCPRMIHLGIWDHVELRETGPLWIENIYVRTERSAERGHIVHIDIASRGVGPMELVARVRDPIGAVVASTHRRCDAIEPGDEVLNTIELELTDAQLWWPNGAGAQPLYHADVELRVDGELSDVRTVRFGVRTIELAPNPGAEAGARPYTIVVNGRALYINGWNWVPIDALYGVPRADKLARLTELARRAHVNMLRVWGGGLIERADFYDRCDELGLLVWQEFSLSSSLVESKPSEAPSYLALMADEARAIVPRRRNQPSLALWCGGNELLDRDGNPLGDDEPVLGTLRRVVSELDPGRPWLPTSPSGRVFLNRIDHIDRDPDGLHDVHGPWEHQGAAAHYQLYDRGTSLLSSEFGVEGMTNRRAFEALVPAADRWPPGRDNRVMAHLGSWWNNAPLVDATFGRFNADELELLRRASQFLQADGLRYAIEANRRRAPRNSGSLPWQLNESYPNAWCTAAVDYHGEPKPAYHAVKRAYAPILVAAALGRQAFDGPELAATLWLARSATATIEPDLDLHVRLINAHGSVLHTDRFDVIAANDSVPYADRLGPPAASSPTAVYATRVRVPASSGRTALAPVTRIGDIRWSLADVPLDAGEASFLLLDLALSRGGERLADNRYLLARGSDLKPMRAVSATELEVDVARRGNTWELRVTNRGPRVAIDVAIEELRPLGAAGWLYIDDTGFSLLPGEMRAISVEWSGVHAEDRKIRIGAWNASWRELWASEE